MLLPVGGSAEATEEAFGVGISGELLSDTRQFFSRRPSLVRQAGHLTSRDHWIISQSQWR